MVLCNRYPWKYSVIAAVGIEPSYMVLLLLVHISAIILITFLLDFLCLLQDVIKGKQLHGKAIIIILEHFVQSIKSHFLLPKFFDPRHIRYFISRANHHSKYPEKRLMTTPQGGIFMTNPS